MVPSGGSRGIYKVASPRGINPEADLTGWSHTGWLVLDEQGAMEGSGPWVKGEHVSEGLVKFSSPSPITDTNADQLEKIIY